MNVAMSVPALLWFLVVLQCSDTASAGYFTNGFPKKLVTDIFSRPERSAHTRLVPEMSFTCNGTIVGFTVAGRQRSGRSTDSIIQIWRENSSQPDVYYKTGTDIVITDSEAVCAETSIIFQEFSNANNPDLVLQCNLNEVNQVLVQPGDILGLKLPPRDETTFRLAFASVSRGPTNYVFEHLPYPGVAVLSNADSTNQQLPQITLQVESESDCSKCVSGFPGMPVFEVDHRTDPNNVTTHLIPDMNFTHPATIVGFIVAGRLFNEEPHSKIQIWRQNSSQPGVYYRVEPDITVDTDMICMSAFEVVDNVLSCILNDDYRVLVQPGDFLGLELPNTDIESEIYFTSGGPINYVFQGELNSMIELNDPGCTQLRPQIAFNLTSGNCTRGFPNKLSTAGEGQGNNSNVTTQLFPNLTFGCNGTIVSLTVTVSVKNGQQGPKIQIWRENDTSSGLYYKPGPDILISNSSCEDFTLSEGICRCTLSESARVSVQPGDILGLEIPPTNDDDYEVLFTTNNGSETYVFQRQLSSTVNFSEADSVTNNLVPQITFLVILDENTDLCRGNAINSLVPPVCIPQSTRTTTVTSDSLSKSAIAGISSFVVVTTLLALIILLMVIMIIVQRKKGKKETIINSDDNAYSNLAYNNGTPVVVANSTAFASVLYRAVAEENTDRPAPDYDEIIDENRESSKTINNHIPTKAQPDFNDYCGSPHQCNHALYDSEVQEEDSNRQTPKEDDTYWEPAATVNELYRQLSSKKYREIPQQEVEIKSTLGSGQFGEVLKGLWESPMGSVDVAVKQLQPGASDEDKVKFLQEAAINGQFRHPNVIQLMGVVTLGEPIMIVLELLSNGDLRKFLIKQQPSAENQAAGVDKHVLLRFCQHIATGMSYLAMKAFVHRDLAARNILVSGDKICKISDFGMSRNLMDENYYVSHGGKVPVKWTAPEAIHYKKYSTASDVWSFGCVMYEIWSLGHKPFENHTNAEAVKMIDDGYRLPPPPGLSKELYKIMLQCWQPDRSNRPTFHQLVEMLSRADFELFVWEEEDVRNSDPQVKVIGAPLETAKDLYHELQRTYLSC